MTEDANNRESQHDVHPKPAAIEVSVALVTSLSTSTNASFDQFVSEFSKRISDKADELFKGETEPTAVPKST